MKKIILSALMLITIYGAHANENFIQMPNPKTIQRSEWHLFPRPIEIKKTGNKVIVVFDRKEWERVRYMQGKRWQHLDEVRKQREWLERRREYWNKQKNK